MTVTIKIKYGILAQVVEHLTFNQVVGGSNPPCLIILGFMAISRNLTINPFLLYSIVLFMNQEIYLLLTVVYVLIWKI